MTAPDGVGIVEEPSSALAEHARVPIRFIVDRVLDVDTMTERPVAIPWTKDYDALDRGPAGWAARFDVSRWGLIAAHANGERIGGAVVAFDTPDFDMLAGRRDLAVLWDLRVASTWRGRGVGRALWRATETWASARACRRLVVETQQINAAACAFYRAMGCTLGAVVPHAYPGLPDEVRLLWHRDLPAR